MHTRIQKNLLLVMLLQGIASAAFAASAIATRLDDPKAVYLTAPGFGAHAGGKSDDSAALQAAIDNAENNSPEGIVFVAPGQYRRTRTIYVWHRYIALLNYHDTWQCPLLPGQFCEPIGLGRVLALANW